MTTATKYKTYPKYKPSGIDWLGGIPDGWEVKRLKYGFYFTKGKNAALYTAEYNADHAGDYPVYSGQTEGEGVMGSIDSYDYDFEKVIFTTTVGAKVMTPLLLSGKFSLSQNCLLMIKSSKQVDEKYFYYQLFPLFDREKSLVPSHMQPSLRFSDLNTFDVAYPEITEQKEIVAFLDRKTAKIDEMVAKKQKMINLLKEKRQALITHAVTKGLDPKAKLKPSGIDWLGDIPEGWEIKKLGHLLDYKKGIKIGPFGSQLTLDEMVESGYKVYGQENVINNDFELGKRYITEDKFKEMSVYEIKPYDLLITMMGTTGNCQIVPKHIFAGIMDSHLIRIRFNEQKILSLFVQILVSQVYYVKEQIDSIGQGSIMSGLNSSIIKSLFFVVPPLNEQNKIINNIVLQNRKIDEMVKKMEMQIEKLQEYRQALITSAVTGKIMVN